MAEERNLTTDEQIRTRAYYLWEADGRPHGRDWEYWMKAKQELSRTTESSKQPAASASSATAATSAKRSNNAETKPAATTQKRRTSARSAVLA